MLGEEHNTVYIIARSENSHVILKKAPRRELKLNLLLESVSFMAKSLFPVRCVFNIIIIEEEENRGTPARQGE